MAWTEIQVPAHPATTLRVTCLYEGGRNGRYRVEAYDDASPGSLPVHSATYDFARWRGHCAGQLLMPDFVSAAEQARDRSSMAARIGS